MSLVSATRVPLRLTLIHPSIGRRADQRRYIRAWQMEPLPLATLSSLTPGRVEKRFYDDRLEAIPFNEPTDLVAISVETYTARRAYQIASEYRRRGVPVVMGGFHASLCLEEVATYAESVVIGEAELVWPQVIADYLAGQPQKYYRSAARPSFLARPDRSIYAGRKYLPIGLVEAGRGCRFNCDFCSVQTVFSASHTSRPVEEVVAEVKAAQRPRQMIFFVDDNIAADMEAAKSLLKALIPLKLRWCSQCSIHAAADDEFLDLLRRSGCQGLLIGFESFSPQNLQQMNKPFNGGLDRAAGVMARFRHYGIRIYGTFIFGYDHDTAASFSEALDFAVDQGLFIAAFNHITPFPGTPLYQRLKQEGRLRYETWWLNERYRYGEVPFRPRGMDAEEVQRRCIEARKAFYSWRSIARRSLHRVNRSGVLMHASYWAINAMHRGDVGIRSGLPLGDQAWRGSMLPARG